VVIVQADQARALRNEKIFAGRRVKDVLRDLGGDLAWKIGADTGIGTETGFGGPCRRKPLQTPQFDWWRRAPLVNGPGLRNGFGHLIGGLRLCPRSPVPPLKRDDPVQIQALVVLFTRVFVLARPKPTPGKPPGPARTPESIP
jgi:hypothetical protein